MMMKINKVLNAITDRLERLSVLDDPGEKLSGLVQKAVANPLVRDATSGTRVGHPVHPLLVTVPIGSWTSALLFDVLGDDDAARIMVATGIIAAVPTAITGLSDWSYTDDAERRVGLVHAAANTVALAAYAGSWLARRGGHRRTGIALSLLGISAVSGGGWLGGHLSYAMGVGVDTTAFQHSEEEWTDVTAPAEGGAVALAPDQLRADQLQADVLTAGELDGVPLVLTRLPDRVVAYADRCTHRGAPLHEGRISGGCVVCPWHDSAFDLTDGEVASGPATRPQASFETRVVDGRLQARRTDPRSFRTNPVGR